MQQTLTYPGRSQKPCLLSILVRMGGFLSLPPHAKGYQRVINGFRNALNVVAGDEPLSSPCQFSGWQFFRHDRLLSPVNLV